MNSVNILTNWSTVEWGKVGPFLILTALISMTLSQEAHGGPTQPATPMTETEVMNSGLQEVSPQILDIVVRRGDPFIEVYLKGMGYLKCYDVHEYDVERGDSKTVIIPRLKRSKPSEPCEQTLGEFEDKVADLDPNLDSAYSLEVLGYKGWYKKELPRP
ncbi:MAG: hypothetical protein ABIR96_06750 [Bdellovibrionota bacterium]